MDFYKGRISPNTLQIALNPPKILPLWISSVYTPEGQYKMHVRASADHYAQNLILVRIFEFFKILFREVFGFNWLPFGTRTGSEAREKIDLGCVKRSSQTDTSRPIYERKTDEVHE